jgi:general secretion pathway protein D
MNPLRLRPVRSHRLTAVVLTVLVLSGCEATRFHRLGTEQRDQGQSTQALDSFRRAMELEPTNAKFRIDYLKHRTASTQSLSALAHKERAAGRVEEAKAIYRQILVLDAEHEVARRGLQSIESQQRADLAYASAEKNFKAGQVATAADALRALLKENPQHDNARTLLRAATDKLEDDRRSRETQLASQSILRRPVTLQFRDANLRMVLEALSKTTSLNVILDRDVRSDLRTTIYVQNAAVEDAVDLILLQNQLEKRVLNSNSIFVYPAVAAKQREYAELKVRTFQLQNIDPQFMANVIKTMLKTKDIVVDAKSGTLVMRDTPDAISVAERLVAAQDIADPEVMLEIEVLEVSSDRLSEIGIKWPEGISASTGSGGSMTWGAMRALRRDDLLVTPLQIGANFKMQDTETNILASPRIRARNKEKAKVLVGDRVANITNVVTQSLGGSTSALVGQIQYVDVGLKVEVEPQIYANDEVGIKINLEVSNITSERIVAGGSAYNIGTRMAQTSLRLKDGETQILAGLIRDEDRTVGDKVPGLGQIPLVGKLFGSSKVDGKKSEIILSITPRIIRPQQTADSANRDVWSGTDATVRDRPLRLDPIGAIRTGPMGAEVAPPARAGQATAPSTGTTLTNPSRPGFTPSSAAGAASPAGASNAAPTAVGPTTGNANTGAAAPNNPGRVNQGVEPRPSTGTVTPIPIHSGAPASIRPGRALSPAAPTSPAGRPTPAATPPAE